MAQAPSQRYPKRNRSVSFHLEPYILDYNSDDDLEHDILDNEIEDSLSSISNSSISESEDQVSSEESSISNMDQSTSIDGINSLVSRNGTIWLDSYTGICENFPKDHVPSLTSYSQNSTTMLGNLF